MRYLKVTFFVLAVSLIWARPVAASTIQCSTLNIDITGQVTNTAGCQYSDTYTNDPASPPIEVNDDAFFGFTDWTLAQQGISINAASGTWDVTGFSNYANYQWLIIFKDGNLTPGPNAVAAPLIGYLSAPGFFSGTWQTPFLANFWATGIPSTSRNVSHISYYFRETGQPLPVPEPATLLMLGTGLAGLGYVLRRKIAK